MYERAEQEWPWIGVINYWFFTRPDDSETNQSFFYFRMVKPDYQPETPTFTPLPVYESMKDYIHNHTPVLYAGVHQAENWAVTLPDDAELVKVDGAQFGQVVDTSDVTFTAYGTDVIIRWYGEMSFLAETNGVFETFDINQQLSEDGQYECEHWGHVVTVLREIDASCGDITVGKDGWLTARIAQSATATQFEIHLSRLIDVEDDTTFQLDSITVIDRTYENVYPIAATGIALGIFALWVIASALRTRFNNKREE
jgi:hypothetical protein